MIRWTRSFLGVLLAVAAFGSNAQTCNTTINPGNDVNATVAGMTAGQVLCLNPGSYPPSFVGFPSNGSFAIGNGVIVKGLGAGPANVVLQASNAADHAVYFTNYLNNGKVASGGQLINLTIAGSPGGIQVYNFTQLPAGRLTDIKFKDVVISTTGNAGVFGVLLRNADRIVLDNVTVSSRNTVLNFVDVTDSLVMNSTIPNSIAEAAAALSVQGGGGNRFINNTIGQSRTSAGAGYSFNGGGVVFYNSSENRFENNFLQGMRDDALDYSITDLSSFAPGSVIPLQKSLNNYVGKNLIVHTAFSLNGSVLGSAGIWSNCASDGTWIYGNEVTGAAECGICSWGGKSNMVLGNWNYNNGISGIFVSGGQEAEPFCAPAGNLTFRQKPVSTFLMGNGNWYNKNDQVVVRNADTTTISHGFESPNRERGGPLQACTNPACQSAWSIETDTGAFGASSTGTRILGNISLNNYRGIWVDYADTTLSEFYLNRIINSTNSRVVTGSVLNIDRGPTLGGNYWSQFVPTGNPSSGQPYTGVFHNTSNNTGNVVDRYPYQHQDLGRGYNIFVSEPRANSSFAQGTRRTVRWTSVGCVFVDLTLGGEALKTDVPNTGYAIVRIPYGATIGSATIVASCKDSGGTVRSTSSSPTFAVTPGSLQLLTPGRDEQFNASQNIWVSWLNTNPATTSIVIEYSPDAGATWPATLATINNVNTNPVTSARVTLPGPTGSAYAMIRVRAGTSIDQTDGVFSVRGATGGLVNGSAGRVFVMGQTERLEWLSPTNSRLVTITATVNGNTQTVATDLPDRGSYDWIVPEFGSASALSMTLSFKSITGVAIGAPVVTANAGVMRYPTTITWGAPPGIAPGSSAPITVTTNSTAPVTITSQTPSVCTVTAPNTINGIANGTCTLAGNAAAVSVFTAAQQSTITFTAGLTQTVTFAQPQSYIGVGASIALVASASSGGPITFTSLTPGICSISGANVLTGNTVGTCTVAADQPGFGGYGAAAQVQRSLFSVAPANIPRLANISTRAQVLTGVDVLIGGFVIGGGTPKTIVVRARGPSLTPTGVTGALANPVLQLFQGQTVIASNDNWQTAANAATLQASGFAPPDPAEAAIYTAIGPGPFTAIVTGAGGSTGVGLMEVFEVDHPELPLVNIATRGKVLTGVDVMIAGFIIQGQAAQTVVVRARGPSLTSTGVTGALANPRLQLFQGQTELSNNDNWGDAANAAQLQASGFAPQDPLEAAILVTLNPGAYTAIVTGVGGTTGVGIVEVFGVP